VPRAPIRSPEWLAQALLSKPVTQGRVRRLLWHAAKGTEANFRQMLTLIPDAAVRAQVEAASKPVQFRG